MDVYLDVKLGKVKAKLFSLCGCNINRLAWIFFFLLMCEQFLSAAIEILFWGERFVHAGDGIAFIIFPVAFLYYANELGEFLLKMVTDAEIED